ncbi:MAG: CDP-diacylglycerol--serine O-phosphatidyltransferase [Deltaproteobacteria bacterium]|nr:CDP-diacylglycerol--serine O-phosphatidyltransferase [Deltaproteobacteria bacterium]MCX7952334.1 CDP-diacylglycerol--serine O-phosphatidyltransferase [Deltaproteobacteria bacterium]
MKSISKAKFLIPNLFTLGNLLCGYLSIFYGVSGRIDLACRLILVGAFLDFVDGLVARRFDSQTRFGLEFDSLADLITFGVGPSFVAMYFFYSSNVGNVGALFGFIYCSAVAIRLARFNTSDTGLIHFRGLPSPASAIALASVCYLLFEQNVPFTLSSVILALILIILAFFSVSRLVFLSLKTDLKVSLFQKFLIAALLALVVYLDWWGILILSYAYILSGPAIQLGKIPSLRRLVNIFFNRRNF